MSKWKAPALTDGVPAQSAVQGAEAMGSDCAFANIYLLRNKYQTEICFFNGFLLRRYRGKGSRCGYTFPLGAGDVRPALEALQKDCAGSGEPLRFILLTQEQKACLEQLFPGQYTFATDPGDGDYIYNAAHLATLPGRAFNKKRNHIRRFERFCPDWRYVPLCKENREDALQVAKQWKADGVETDTVCHEYLAIRDALEHLEELGLTGGILYAEGEPVAMAVGSRITEKTADVHFEKAIGVYAENGAYAVINRCYAQSLQGVEWLNREEDINIPGLRKAKLSYHPALILTKYTATPAKK